MESICWFLIWKVHLEPLHQWDIFLQHYFDKHPNNCPVGWLFGCESLTAPTCRMNHCCQLKMDKCKWLIYLQSTVYTLNASFTNCCFPVYVSSMRTLVSGQSSKAVTTEMFCMISCGVESELFPFHPRRWDPSKLP